MKQKTSITEICARSCSCSYKNIIPKEVFIKILRGNVDLLDEWIAHIIYFLNETPIDWVCLVMKELDLTIEDLYKINDKISEIFKSKRLGSIDEYFKYHFKSTK